METVFQFNLNLMLLMLWLDGDGETRNSVSPENLLNSYIVR